MAFSLPVVPPRLGRPGATRSLLAWTPWVSAWAAPAPWKLPLRLALPSRCLPVGYLRAGPGVCEHLAASSTPDGTVSPAPALCGTVSLGPQSPWRWAQLSVQLSGQAQILHMLGIPHTFSISQLINGRTMPSWNYLYLERWKDTLSSKLLCAYSKQSMVTRSPCPKGPALGFLCT